MYLFTGFKKKNVNAYVCLPLYTESVCVCKKMEETID